MPARFASRLGAFDGGWAPAGGSVGRVLALDGGKREKVLTHPGFCTSMRGASRVRVAMSMIEKDCEEEGSFK